MLHNDKKKEISFSTLQGETALTSIPKELREHTDSVIYLRDGEILSKSSAALCLLSDVGGWRKLLQFFFVFPRPVRDWGYDVIAKHRYKWFGKTETCEIPSSDNSTKILP